MRIRRSASFLLAETVVLGLMVTPRLLRPQSQKTLRSPEFEVASVKRGRTFVSAPGSGSMLWCWFHGSRTYYLSGCPAEDYPDEGVWPGRSTRKSRPSWIDDSSAGDANYFTITATMPPNTTTEQFQLMLQNLLAERFHLVVHHETKGFPGYELVLANGGSKLKEGPTAEANSGAPAGLPDRGLDGPPIQRPKSPVGTIMPRPGTWGMFRLVYREPMAQLAASLGTLVNASNGADNSVTPRVV